jgi:transposase
MARKSKAVDDELYNKAVEALKDKEKNAKVLIKLQAIKSSRHEEITQVAKVLSVARSTIMDWIKYFKEGGVDRLHIKPGRGLPPTITKDEKEIIRSWILAEPNLTGPKVIVKIRENFGKTIMETLVYNIIHELKFSYITPRPQHHKQDKTAQVEFKKKSRQKTRRKPRL